MRAFRRLRHHGFGGGTLRRQMLPRPGAIVPFNRLSTMIYIVLLAIAVCIGTIFHYQAQLRKYQRRELSQMPAGDEVISLDEEDSSGRGRYDAEQGPSRVPMFASLGVAVLLILFYVFYGGSSGPAAEGRYIEVAAKAMGTYLVGQKQFTTGTTAVAIVSRDVFEEYEELEDKSKSRLIEALDSGLRVGNRVKLVGLVPLYADSDRDGPPRLQVEQLRDVLREYKDVDIVISLVGFPQDIEQADLSSEALPYFAVYEERAMLYRFTRLVKDGAVDLVILGRGTFNSDQNVQGGASMEEVVEQHFLFLTPATVRNIEKDFRQYAGRFPMYENDWCP